VFGWKKKDNNKETQAKIHEILEQAEAETPTTGLKKQPTHSNPYETQEMVDTYLNFHFGASNFGVENYPFVCSQVCI